MIRDDEFNKKWWGKKVGIITTGAFFSLRKTEQEERLKTYAWVEFKASLDAAPGLFLIHDAGFFWVDTRVRFRINLAKIRSSASVAALEIRFADKAPFAISELEPAPFKHERFAHLPGVSEVKLVDRYLLWSNGMISLHPAWCMQILSKGAVQGWFLSEPKGEGLDLTLAMLHRDAHISGLLLYQAALAAYAARGATLGSASFSATDTTVLNIYSQLGARFASTEVCWMWIKEAPV